MYEHLKKLGDKPEYCQESFDPRQINHLLNHEINKLFTKQEIEILLKHLKDNKSCGIDNIINEFLKFCPIEMKSTIVKIFNIVLNTGLIQ